ncbi:MAG: VWA domain-containing protein [Lentisphaeraceae bacterium]|nr:VWA domain-containing protein [Lentisphaeraceae bacterium]
MNKILCLLALLMVSLPAQEQVVEEIPEVEEPVLLRGPSWYEKDLNKDGSLGDKNRDVLSSMMLLAFLAHGETPSSKHYGEIINNCTSYLLSQIKEKNSLLEDAFILYALQEFHAMVGVGGFEPHLKSQKLKIYESFKKDHFVAEENEVLANYILAFALSPSYSGNDSDKLILKKLRKWMELQRGHQAALMSLHLKSKDQDFDKEAIELVLNLKLNKKIDSYLEHLVTTRLLFTIGGNVWSDWNRFHQKEMGSIQNKDGSWPGDPVPGFLNKSENDAKLCNSLLAALSMTVYYRYLPSSKGPSVYGGRASAIAMFGGLAKSKQERYSPIVENRFRSPLQSPLSTFAADVDTASYSNIRRFINAGTLPPSDAVRIEEMVNYFQYQRKGERLDIWQVDHEMSVCPWNANSMLLKTTLSTDELMAEELPPKNLVFLIDVSGSMDNPNKLPLLKRALNLLIFKLKKEDKISIVTYAGAERVVLDSVSGDKHFDIIKALDNLDSGGGTNGSAGIEKAYEIAQKNFIKDGINRVILCTDGDFNVGIDDISSLKKFIGEKAKSNVFLTVMGFGEGNYRDDITEQLTNHGNGQAFYIDTLLEAKKALVDEMGATLSILAKDVKLQIEFNPGMVESYRLVGYENRLLNAEDFDNDKIDAGEVGSGHQVTALYEIKLRTQPLDKEREQQKLKYQEIKLKNNAEMLSLKIRYKKPNEDISKLVESSFNGEIASKPSVDWDLSAGVALAGMIFRDSAYVSDGGFKSVVEMVSRTLENDKFGYQNEFKKLIQQSMVLKELQTSVQKEGDVEEHLDLVD